MNDVKFNIGDKVRYLGSKEDKEFPQYYPPIGTIGTIVEVDDDGTLLVDWGNVGTVEQPYTWWVNHKRIELVEGCGV